MAVWNRSRRALHRLEQHQLFPLDQAQVFRFFEEPANLARITPPSLGFRMASDQPVVMREGAVIDYTIRWLSFRLQWRTEITRYQPPLEFVDEQTKGPYAFWRHTHRFVPVPGGTEMSDLVEYALPFGVFGRLAHALLVQRQLREIFDYRRIMVQRLLLSEQGRRTL